MGQTGVAAQSIPQGGDLGAAMPSQHRRNQSIFDVVSPGNSQFLPKHQRMGFASGVPQMQHSRLIAPGTGQPSISPTKPRLPPLARGQRMEAFFYRRKPQIRPALSLKDTELGLQVALHIPMAGQVIGRKVQQYRGFRVEVSDGFQLIAGAFHCKSSALSGVLQGFDQGHSEVATGHGRNTSLLQEVGGQICNGAFSIGASDGQHHGTICPGPEHSVCQLQFANHGNATAQRLFHKGNAGRHPRAQDHFLAVIEKRKGVIPPHTRNTDGRQLGDNGLSRQALPLVDNDIFTSLRKVRRCRKA